MKIFKVRIAATSVFLGSALCLGAPAAHAGFEWTPPPVSATTAQPGPAIQARPIDTVDMMPLPIDAPPISPRPYNAEPLPPSTSPATWPEATSGMEGGVMRPHPSITPEPTSVATPAPRPPQAATPRSSPSVSPSSASYFNTVEGFGRDIPLALAMQQIVPPDYAYSFDRGVQPSLRIDWEGGQPWDAILDDALRPHGLSAQILENTVWIRTRDASLLQSRQGQAPTQATAQPLQTRDVGVMPAVHAEPVMPLRAERPYETTVRRDPLRRMMKADHTEAASPPQAVHTPGQTQTPTPGTAAPHRQPAMSETHQPVSLAPPAAAPITRSMTEPGNAADISTVRVWQAHQGDSLYQTMSNWAETAGVVLHWQGDTDYQIHNAINMHGTFADALNAILTAYSHHPDRPVGRLYPNLPQGPSVLLIQTN